MFKFVRNVYDWASTESEFTGALLLFSGIGSAFLLVYLLGLFIVWRLGLPDLRLIFVCLIFIITPFIAYLLRNKGK